MGVKPLDAIEMIDEIGKQPGGVRQLGVAYASTLHAIL
jgi:hypothetical protein